MGNLVALGAVVLREEHLKPYADDFYRVYDDYGVPHEVETKWSMGRKNWFAQSGRTSDLTPMRKDLLRAAHNHKVRAIVVVWDCARVASANGKGPEEGVIDFLFERISMFLEKVDDLGLVVFDKPGGGHREEDEWIAGTRYLTELGTDYVKSTAVVTPILTAPSHHHPQLQLADLVTGSVTNAVAGGKYGQELMPEIKPMLITNWRGNIGGTGLKLYPDQINNLQYWLHGEEEFTRGAGGISLPAQRWHYYEDDGLVANGRIP